jgi:hypothetical protein
MFRINRSSGLESRIRRLADSKGYRVRRDRRREVHPLDKGFALFDCSTRVPVFGWDYDASLEEIEQWLQPVNEPEDAAASVIS